MPSIYQRAPSAAAPETTPHQKLPRLEIPLAGALTQTMPYSEYSTFDALMMVITVFIFIYILKNS
jgi:hypothetical protein